MYSAPGIPKRPGNEQVSTLYFTTPVIAAGWLEAEGCCAVSFESGAL
jgi:hypothetical protein